MTLTMIDPTATQRIGRTATVVLPDRFDVHEVPRFREQIAEALASGDTVSVVDASRVRFLDTTAIDALVATRLRCRRRGGEMVLAAPSVAARIVLELAGRYEACNPVEVDRLGGGGVSAVIVHDVVDHRGIGLDTIDPGSIGHATVSQATVDHPAVDRPDSGRGEAVDHLPARLTAAGAVDALAAQRLREDGQSMVAAAPQHIVIDLGGVTRLDAAGLAAVTHTALAARRHGITCRIEAPRHAEATRIFELTGLAGLLDPNGTAR